MRQFISTIGITLKKHLPQRKLALDILMEIGILAVVYVVYMYSRGSVDAKEVTALEHAREIMDLEKAMGIFVELDIQSWFLDSSAMTHFANILYTICYYPAVIIFAIWAYWRYRSKYKFMRTVFVISAIIAFISFALYPTAPPRFFDGRELDTITVEDLGFVDTIAEHWDKNESSDPNTYNPFAAMPSLHFGWTVMVSAGLLWMTRSRFGRALAVILPIAMFFGITSTANHFILDAVAGAIVIGIAFWLTALIFRHKHKLSFIWSKRTHS
ncbi:MAG: phosphatase PAP2 family protein [Chloroflexi bacterium]|nr:phosphatase PAP2 family protein [Chloroflexota bacterium]